MGFLGVSTEFLHSDILKKKKKKIPYVLITHLGLQATSLDQLLINTLTCRRSKLPQKNKPYVIPIHTLPDRRGPCHRPPPGPPPSAQDARGCVGGGSGPGGRGGWPEPLNSVCEQKAMAESRKLWALREVCYKHQWGVNTGSRVGATRSRACSAAPPPEAQREVSGLKFEILFSLLLPR